MDHKEGNFDTNDNSIKDLDEKQPANTEAGVDNQEAATAKTQEALAAKAQECEDITDKYLRLAAEFENYKRLALRDQRDHIKFGNEQLLKELLQVIDNMERAIKAGRDTDGNGGSLALVQGVDLTLKQLSSVLAKFGVRAIETVGQAFDPSAHQAVSHVPSASVPSNHVIDEFQKGYRLHDRILRAAMVSVSSGLPNTGDQESISN